MKKDLNWGKGDSSLLSSSTDQRYLRHSQISGGVQSTKTTRQDPSRDVISSSYSTIAPRMASDIKTTHIVPVRCVLGILPWHPKHK